MPDRIDERRTSARQELERALDPVGPPIGMMARRRRRGRVVATSVAGFVFLMIAAGLVLGASNHDGEHLRTSSRSNPRVTWIRQRVRVPMGSDQGAPIATDADRTVMLTIDDSGTVTSLVWDGAGRMRTGSPVRTGKDLLGFGGSALVHAKSGWLGVLQGGAGTPGRITPTSVVLHSIDGLRWSQRHATGLDGGEITDLAWVGGRFVAVGFERPTLGPAQPTPIPLAWWSADGDAWHEVALPLPEGAHGMAAGVAVAGTRLVVVGYDDAGAALWSSDDGGTTWTRRALSGAPHFRSATSVAARGDVVVIGGVDGSDGGSDITDVVIRSGDGGRTWRSARWPPPTAPGVEAGGSPVIAGGGRFYRTQKSMVYALGDPAPCYDDLDRCSDSPTRLYTSIDGGRWVAVDRSSATGAGATDADTVAVTGDGQVSTFTFTAPGFTVWTWPAGTNPRTMPTPTTATRPITSLPRDGTPRVGTRYAVPLMLHCGPTWLYLGTEPWRLVDDETPLTRLTHGVNPPARWPIAQQMLFGFVTVTSPGHADYSLPAGTVIGHYAPFAGAPPHCS